MLRNQINEMNCGPGGPGGEMAKSVELRLALAPVVLCPPVAREPLKRRKLHALRLIGDKLLVRPPGRRDATFQVGESLIREVDAEGADGGCCAVEVLGARLGRHVL